MKPQTPGQLARLLDQLTGSYPNGIPVDLLKARSEVEGEGVDTQAAPRFHIFVVGEEGSLSGEAQTLLSAIAAKGLKIEASEYLVRYHIDQDIERAALESASPHVIVFGASRETGWGARGDGSSVLFTSSLDAMVTDPALKKALWKDLQTFL